MNSNSQSYSGDDIHEIVVSEVHGGYQKKHRPSEGNFSEGSVVSSG